MRLYAAFLLVSLPLVAQDSFRWPAGKKLAVSLSFDARVSQPKVGLELFRKHPAKVTFYVGPRGVERDLAGWKQLVADGHEIGNHSTSHPCPGNFIWSRKNALEEYSMAKLTEDIDGATRDIEKLLGVKTVSFAYPCGMKTIGRGADTQSYVPVVAKRFRTSRGFRDEAANDPGYVDFAQITGVESDGMTFEAMKTATEAAAKAGGWLVFAGHEIGKPGNQTTDADALAKYIDWVKDPANGVWLDTVDSIARYVEANRPPLPQTAPIRRESIEWTDVWMPNTNDHALPRVLLVGDSITRGYYSAVEEKLKGKAYVARFTTSKAVGDPALLSELATFLQENRYDVIHFNVGMHGWEYTESEYRRDFPALVAALRQNAPAARLVWANTTPVRKDRDKGASNARIDVRNTIVRDLATAETIPVDDLHSAIASRDDLHSDDVHYSKEGYAILAERVAGEVVKLLPGH